MQSYTQLLDCATLRVLTQLLGVRPGLDVDVGKGYGDVRQAGIATRVAYGRAWPGIKRNRLGLPTRAR